MPITFSNLIYSLTLNEIFQVVLLRVYLLYLYTEIDILEKNRSIILNNIHTIKHYFYYVHTLKHSMLGMHRAEPALTSGLRANGLSQTSNSTSMNIKHVK